MKLGIAGTGMIVKQVLPLISGWDWQVEALCSTPRSRGVMEQLCKEYRIPRGFTDFGEMLREDLDAVYVAVSNHLHYDLTRQALEAGKNVIVEKPITSNDREAAELAALAREKGLFLFEAISTLYLPAYARTREWLSRIGSVKLVNCNFSQYSSRYDAFCRGEIAPVFDRQKSGGVVMDLNIYNLHYVMGLFGKPESVAYSANMEQNVDISGVVTLGYRGFQVVCMAAKDCGGPCGALIQGTKGYIRMDGPANSCGPVTLHLNDGTEECFLPQTGHRMEAEFRHFAREIASGDRTACCRALEHSVLVSQVQTIARKSAGIVFPAD